jgi:pentatricopeptide repeat protein
MLSGLEIFAIIKNDVSFLSQGERGKMSSSHLGKVDVQRRAMKIEELSDRVNTAVALYKSAQRKFEEGQDSRKEWKNIIKVLNVEIKNIQRFIAIATHNIGVIYAGQRDLERAREYFEKAIEIDDEYSIAYYNLAVVYKETGDMNKARELYQKARELGYSPDR